LLPKQWDDPDAGIDVLTRIALRNFKCFESVELDPRLITVLIGPNGSGKSSVAQALMLLRQSLGHRELQLQGPFVNLVSSYAVVFANDTARPIGIRIGGEAVNGDLPVVFGYDAEFRLAGALAHHRGVLEWDCQDLEISWTPINAESRQVERRIGSTSFTVGANSIIGRPVALSSNSVGLSRNSAVNGLVTIWARVIDSWRFVPALRGFARSSFDLSPGKSEDIFSAQAHDVVSGQVAGSLVYERNVEREVASWIQSITGVSIGHAINEGPQITAEALSPITGMEVPIINEGFGTNQLVFMMVQVAKALMGGLITIEEPESHLHPFAIARLGDLFVSIAKERQLQFLLTTHSEHLLLSLLNNVAEGKLQTDDLAIYYFERGDDQCRATPLEITSEGMVKGGLPGFFDATLAAQRRHLDALSSTS
jgi:energy-coupling factor transporter ATP-binding protein EcfA2